VTRTSGLTPGQVSTGSDVSQQHHHAGPPLQQDVIFNFIGNEFCRSSSRTWVKIFDPVRPFTHNPVLYDFR
jgi:hypothetical protein